MHSITPRTLASVVGKIISLAPSVGNVTLIMSRYLQSAVNFLGEFWEIPIDLTKYQYFSHCMDEIDFWLLNCSKINGKSLLHYSAPVVIIHTDASAFACGGHVLCFDSEEFELYFQAFTSMQKIQDSNARELLAILYGLQSFKSLVQGKTVKIFTDNVNAVVIAKKGSMSFRLHDLAIRIFSFCVRNNVSLEIEWIPRSLNGFADCMSRIVDYDNWRLSTQFFDYISLIFGPFSVDCFASSDNNKCAKFFSKFWCPGSSDVCVQCQFGR